MDADDEEQLIAIATRLPQLQGRVRARTATAPIPALGVRAVPSRCLPRPRHRHLRARRTSQSSWLEHKNDLECMRRLDLASVAPQRTDIALSKIQEHRSGTLETMVRDKDEAALQTQAGIYVCPPSSDRNTRGCNVASIPASCRPILIRMRSCTKRTREYTLHVRKSR